MDYAEIVVAAAEELGLPDVEFDPGEATLLDFGDGIEVGIEAGAGDGDGSFLLYSLAGVEPGAGADLLARLLDANAFYRGPGDTVTAFDPDSGEIWLRKALAAPDLDAEALAGAVLDMVYETEGWRDLLSGRAEAFETPPGGDDRPLPPAALGMMA